MDLALVKKIMNEYEAAVAVKKTAEKNIEVIAARLWKELGLVSTGTNEKTEQFIPEHVFNQLMFERDQKRILRAAKKRQQNQLNS